MAKLVLERPAQFKGSLSEEHAWEDYQVQYIVLNIRKTFRN